MFITSTQVKIASPPQNVKPADTNPLAEADGHLPIITKTNPKITEKPKKENYSELESKDLDSACMARLKSIVFAQPACLQSLSSGSVKGR